MRDNTPKPNVFAIELRSVNQGFTRYYSLTEVEWKAAFEYLTKSRMKAEKDTRIAAFLDNANRLTYVRFNDASFSKIKDMMENEYGFDCQSSLYPHLRMTEEAMAILINSIQV